MSWGARMRSAVVCAVTMLALAAAAPAAADTLVISSKPAKPTGITPVRFTVAWSTATPGAAVIVSVEPSTIRKCPASPAGDIGTKVISTVASIYGVAARSKPATFEHGRYVACGWLFAQGRILAKAHEKLKVSNPDRLSMAAPAAVTDGATSSLTFNGVSDIAGPIIYLKRNLGSQRCRADPKKDRGQVLSGAAPAPGTRGAFTSIASLALGAGPTGAPDGAPAGVYTLCAWLLDGALGGGVLTAPASAEVTLKPPTGTLAFTVPELVRAGHRFGVVAKYDSRAADVRLYVHLKRLPDSGPMCGRTHDEDPGAVKRLVISKPGVKTTARLRVSGGGVYVACAWLEWAHGAIDGPFAGRMVVARSHQRPTYWCGKTGQRLRPSQTHHAACAISFETIDGQVVYLSYWARFTCTARGRRRSHKIYATSFPAFGMGSRKAFTGRYDQGHDHAVVSARLKRKHGRGTFTESYRSDAYTCRSGSVRFKVRRA